jgi:Kef-type K+ transport system membrane component KefB
MADFYHLIMHEFKLPLTNPVLVFALILLIILLSPILLKRLNIPGIIGLIISGVIIGPFGMNFLEKNSAVDLFSTIGLLYIMFIAGLDLDMKEFLANRNKSLLFGLFTFIIPFGIAFPFCRYILSYGINASLLIASMFSAHTLVAYPIVSKFGISKNPAVAITVGGTILADTTVLIILAVIMGNSQGNIGHQFWVRLIISLAIFSGIIFYIIPKIAKWFFQKMESEKHAHYIFVLSVVFFSAFLSELAGLEPIIGAFLSGLALNRLIPNSSALMNRIEFIGNSLFIPFFLISVGMLVDISVILKGPLTMIIAISFSIIALFGKWLAALITQLVFKYSKFQRNLIFGLSSSRAAATLAVILVGFNAKILDETVLNGTIVLILLTCIVASIVTEKAAKQIVICTENGEKKTLLESNFYYEHILVPIANIMNIDKLLEFAFLIKDKKSVNPVSILSIVPNNEEAENNILRSRNRLEEYSNHAAASEIKINIIATIDHNAASGIARISREIMADIIILGWPNKPGILERLAGEKIEGIINNVFKNLFICYFKEPLIIHRRIILITAPLAEKEIGFEIWLQKVIRMSNELSMPIAHYGDKNTGEAIRIKARKKSLNATISFNLFIDWDDFLILSRKIHVDDFIILVSARKGFVSHISALDHIPSKLEKHFEKNSKIIIFPQQFRQENLSEGYDDISSIPLSKSI